MESSSYHQPYSHKTRFKVVHSKTKLVKTQKVKAAQLTTNRSPSQFKFVRHPVKQQQQTTNVSRQNLNRSKSIDKSSNSVAKYIGNKYKFIRNSLKKTDCNSYKLDNRKAVTPKVNRGRVVKRKPRASLSKCLIRIRGVRFQTHPNGKCLQRLTSDSDHQKLVTSSMPIKKIEQSTIARANVLKQRSIQICNGRYRLRNLKRKSMTMKKKKNCIYFNRFGKCDRGDKCPFVHDRSRIAVCTQFLNGRCENSSCPYLHELTPGKVPTCFYFIKGACGQDNCPYAHSYVGPDAKICDDFVQGFCSKGNECSKQHVLLCPHFESTGQCPRGKQCHLTHRRKRNENQVLNTKSTSVRPKEELYSISNVMPAYIPLSQESEKKLPAVELKLKPSFLS